jgi:hypothetical protein
MGQNPNPVHKPENPNFDPENFASAPFFSFFLQFRRPFSFFFSAPATSTLPPHAVATNGPLLSKHGDPRRRASRFQVVVHFGDEERLPLLTRNDAGHEEGRRLLHAAEKIAH